MKKSAPPTIDDEKELKRVPCRICGKPCLHNGIISHAAHAHPAEFNNWKQGRGGFGMSIFEILSTARIDKAIIRT